jgi:hypothetical protein
MTENLPKKPQNKTKLNQMQIEYLLEASDNELSGSDLEDICEDSDHDSDPEINPLTEAETIELRQYVGRGDYIWSETYVKLNTNYIKISTICGPIHISIKIY